MNGPQTIGPLKTEFAELPVLSAALLWQHIRIDVRKDLEFRYKLIV